MRCHGRFALLVVAALTLSTASRVPAQDQTRISGRITDSAGVPIPMVAVWVEGFNAGSYSDSAGRYTVTVTGAPVAGRRAALLVRAIGWFAVYDTVALVSGEITRHFVLRATPPLRLHFSRTDSIRQARGQALPACLPADSDDGLLLWMIRSTVTAGPDEPDSINRAISGLPRMDSAGAARRITQLESGPLCELAARAFDRIYPDPDSLRRGAPRRVWLVRVDSLYLVNDPNVHCGEWTPVVTFNQKWVALFSALR